MWFFNKKADLTPTFLNVVAFKAAKGAKAAIIVGIRNPVKEWQPSTSLAKACHRRSTASTGGPCYFLACQPPANQGGQGAQPNQAVGRLARGRPAQPRQGQQTIARYAWASILTPAASAQPRKAAPCSNHRPTKSATICPRIRLARLLIGDLQEIAGKPAPIGPGILQNLLATGAGGLVLQPCPCAEQEL